MDLIAETGEAAVFGTERVGGTGGIAPAACLLPSHLSPSKPLPLLCRVGTVETARGWNPTDRKRLRLFVQTLQMQQEVVMVDFAAYRFFNPLAIGLFFILMTIR